MNIGSVSGPDPGFMAQLDPNLMVLNMKKGFFSICTSSFGSGFSGSDQDIWPIWIRTQEKGVFGIRFFLDQSG